MEEVQCTYKKMSHNVTCHWKVYVPKFIIPDVFVSYIIIIIFIFCKLLLFTRALRSMLEILRNQ